MFRDLFEEVESTLDSWMGRVRSKAYSSKEEFTRMTPKQRREKFVSWGNEYVDKLKSNQWTQQSDKVKESFFSVVRFLGINEELLRQTFASNKKEVLEPVLGEFVAILTLILGWKNKDKEAFSQALGEIGVLGFFAAKPFICLIAICGLAWGYQKSFHADAFKKGGVLGLSGMTAAFLAPGAFTGILAAIVVVVYLNQRIRTDIPVEKQISEIFEHFRSGQFVKETREAWRNFEDFLQRLFINDELENEPEEVN